MDSAAVILSIGSSGNRLRLHLSRNPAAASNPRLASPNWTLYLKPHSVQKNDVIWHKTASWPHGWPLLPFYLLDNHMHLFYQFLLQVNIWRILFWVFSILRMVLDLIEKQDTENCKNFEEIEKCKYEICVDHLNSFQCKIACKMHSIYITLHI